MLVFPSPISLNSSVFWTLKELPVILKLKGSVSADAVVLKNKNALPKKYFSRLSPYILMC